MKIFHTLYIFCLFYLPYQSFSQTTTPGPKTSSVPIFSNPSDSDYVVKCDENQWNSGYCTLTVNTNRTFSKFTPVAKNASQITIVLLSGRLYVLGNEICNAFPNVEELNLDYLGIEKIFPGALDKCTKVKKISLSGNNINHLPRNTFRNNLLIETLWIQANYKLKTLDEWLFASLFNLMDLNLSENYLTEFSPDLLKNNKKIFSLDIGNNELLDVDEIKLLDYLPNLKYLYLDGNHISCDRLQQISQNIQRASIFLLDNTNIGRQMRKRFYLIDTLDGSLCVPISTWLDLYNQQKALKKGDSTYQVSIGRRRN